jgi:hypothetical protein
MMALCETPPTVRDLRRLWKTHKDRLNALRDEHPTAIRVHRAFSWLAGIEELNDDQHADQRLLYQWIAFNALYGQAQQGQPDMPPDRANWQSFLRRVLELDGRRRLIDMLKTHKPLVLCILGDEFLSKYFWQDPSAERAGRAKRTRQFAERWYAEHDYGQLLLETMDRVYLLRCQLVHGGATMGGKLNRKLLRHCNVFLGWLMPAILQVWVDFGADLDWGPMAYPPQGNGRNGRPRPKG